MIFLFPIRSSPSFEQTWKPLQVRLQLANGPVEKVESVQIYKTHTTTNKSSIHLRVKLRCAKNWNASQRSRPTFKESFNL